MQSRRPGIVQLFLSSRINGETVPRVGLTGFRSKVWKDKSLPEMVQSDKKEVPGYPWAIQSSVFAVDHVGGCEGGWA